MVRVAKVSGGRLGGYHPEGRGRPVREGQKKGPVEPRDGEFRALYRAELKARGKT